ncbi:flavin reductase family protein [Pseudomonas sp. SC11]|uniref:flavin reductase family protein n=1 Tax=Pseudomonas sp. SC11 TaxID=326927 RepID=UPI00399973F2
MSILGSTSWVARPEMAAHHGPSDYLSAEFARDHFRQAMRGLVGAVNVVTTMHQGERFGLTATAVCSVSADPPRILACVNVTGRTFRALLDSRRMAINVLARDQQEIAQAFAKFSGEQDDPFAAGTWRAGHTGAPLLENALVSFDCVVAEFFVTPSHAILIGEIREIHVADQRAPLMYFDGVFGTVDQLSG